MRKRKTGALAIVGALLLLCSCGSSRNVPAVANQAGSTSSEMVSMEQNQGAYVSPETATNQTRNVTLPGWGGFTIRADTKHITEGFEFHNPKKNRWYEDQIGFNGVSLENLVVGDGTAVELDHYLYLAGITSKAVKTMEYDQKCFEIAANEEKNLTLKAIRNFEGTKSIRVQTEDGQQVQLDVTCYSECYYMTFGLYLEQGDELLYQSGLVEPGNYIQTMDLSRKLKVGEYPAYVICQPYRSDKETKTNRGIVKITLTVE